MAMRHTLRNCEIDQDLPNNSMIVGNVQNELAMFKDQLGKLMYNITSFKRSRLNTPNPSNFVLNSAIADLRIFLRHPSNTTNPYARGLIHMATAYAKFCDTFRVLPDEDVEEFSQFSPFLKFEPSNYEGEDAVASTSCDSNGRSESLIDTVPQHANEWATEVKIEEPDDVKAMGGSESLLDAVPQHAYVWGTKVKIEEPEDVKAMSHVQSSSDELSLFTKDVSDAVKKEDIDDIDQFIENMDHGMTVASPIDIASSSSSPSILENMMSASRKRRASELPTHHPRLKDTVIHAKEDTQSITATTSSAIRPNQRKRCIVCFEMCVQTVCFPGRTKRALQEEWVARLGLDEEKTRLLLEEFRNRQRNGQDVRWCAKHSPNGEKYIINRPRKAPGSENCPYCVRAPRTQRSFTLETERTLNDHVRRCHPDLYKSFALLDCKVYACDFRARTCRVMDAHAIRVHGDTFKGWINDLRIIMNNQCCSFCDLKFCDADEYKHHLTRIHDMETARSCVGFIGCESCDQYFLWFADLYNHWLSSPSCTGKIVLRKVGT